MKYFQNKDSWNELWSEHAEEYLAAPPRCGYWLAAFFSKRCKILEIAGGTCRDSRYLSDIGFRAIGLDINQFILDYCRKRFPDSSLRLVRGNAFNLPFPDKSFDITFSNGFWICFDDDVELAALVREQARVTRRFMISFVHNQSNKHLVELFRERSRHDRLYNIRFFTVEELREIIDGSGILYKNLRFYKFGGPVDLFYSNRWPTIWRKIAPLIVPRLYKFQPWSHTERIACVVELAWTC